MKFCIFCMFSMLSAFTSKSQFLKDVLQGIKSNGEQTAIDKVNEKINHGIDSITKQPANKNRKKIKDTTTADIAVAQEPTAEPAAGDKDGSAEPGTDTTATGSSPSTEDGYVTMTASASSIFVGGHIYLNGQSILYGTFKTVQLIINGPYSELLPSQTLPGYSKKTSTLTLDKDGKFTSSWNAGQIEGLYTLTVISSDAKATATRNVVVYSLKALDNMGDSDIVLTKKAYENLAKWVDIVKPNISAADANDLDGREKKVKEASDQAIKTYQSINDANKKLASVINNGQPLPVDLSDHLSELNGVLSGQADDMNRMLEITNHQPADNSICEILVMVKEACSVFLAISNVSSGKMVGVLKAITLDRVVPAVASQANKPAGLYQDFKVKETSKIFVTAELDAEELERKLFKANVIADFTEFASEFLLKKYCGLYKGTLKHNYKVIFRNADHETWWKYAVDMEATVELRYPKGMTGRIVKMKGNIEGNATKFQFFADAKVAVKDEMQGRDKYVSVIVLQNFIPLALPFSTSVHDKISLGAAVRGLATPAYFNIPIDAEYDMTTNKIKFFINPALVDFTPAVSNRQVYIALAVLPLVRAMDYPIFKAQETLKGSFREKNEFEMEDAKSPKPKLVDHVTRHISNNSGPFEIFLDTSFEIEKE